MVDVVRGEPEHRDHGLSQAERSSNSVIACCMPRPRSPVPALER